MLGDDSGQLVVALPDETVAGIVAWRNIGTGRPDGGCLEIGIPLRGLAFDGGRWHDGVLYARLRGGMNG